MKKFWNWKNQAETETAERVLELNGTIAEDSWFDDDVTPKLFKEELFNSVGPVTININSPGGDCIAASQIYSMILDYKKVGGHVKAIITGLAASAASVIAMAADELKMSPTALLMIHNPATTAFGDYRDMNKAIELLSEVKESIINAYEQKTNLSRIVISHMMDAETWMNAKKALELKFADGIIGNEETLIPTNSYSFSSKDYASNLINKINKKEGPSPLKSGRNINELKNKLSHIKKYI